MRALRVVAVPLRVEPVPHLEAARERLLTAVLTGYRQLAAPGTARPLEPRLLHGTTTPAGAERRQEGDPAGVPAPGDGPRPGAVRGESRRPVPGSVTDKGPGGKPPLTPRPGGLVVLPALAGLIPLSALAGEPPRWDGRLAALARRFGDAAAEAWAEWSAQAARTLGIYLCPGTVVVPRGDGFEHVALCFGPDGQLLARQPQLHSPPDDHALALVPGDHWAPFTIAGWTASLVVGRDGWIPEVGRWASLEGVRLVVHPGHAREPAPRWEVLAGPWQVVQQTQMYWVHAAPSGSVGGKNLVPQAAVFAPCEITPEGRGWLAWDDTGGPVSAVLERAPLLGIRERYPLDRYLNPALYLRQLLPAYRRLTTAAGERGEGPAPEAPGPVPAPRTPVRDPQDGPAAPAVGEPRRRAGRRRRRRSRVAPPRGAPQGSTGRGTSPLRSDAVAAQDPGGSVLAVPLPAPASDADPYAEPDPAPVPVTGPSPSPGRRRRRRRRRERASTGPATGGPTGDATGRPAGGSGSEAGVDPAREERGGEQ